jgi:hypothetical protein
MDLAIALGLVLATISFAVFCGWMGARPRDYSKPRIVSWQFLMLVSAAVVLVTLVHLVNVLGFTTGPH